MALFSTRPKARTRRLMQRGTIVFTSETSKTATITSVDTGNSSLRHLGTEGVTFPTGTIRLTFTDDTTITGNRQDGGSGATVSFEVETGW